MIITRLATAIFLVILLFTLPACSSNDQKKTKHYQKALEYMKIADDKAAIIEFKNAIQVDAKFADARYQLGLLYLKAGNPRAAFSELQRAVGLNPENLDAGIKVAELYLLANNKIDSRKYVEQVLNANPDYLDGLTLLANLELIEGNFTKADQTLAKALQLAPDNDKFYNIKGQLLTSQNKLAEAEQMFKKALDLNPESFTNHQALLTHYDRNKDELAVQNLLATMLTKFPGNAKIQLLMAKFHEKKGELTKAEKEILQAITLEKDSIPLMLVLVEFYKNHSLHEKAETFLKSNLAEFPKNLQLQVALVELQFELQKFAEARTGMEAILTGNPANGGANLIKARFLIGEGKNTEAIQIIMPLTTDYPKWADPFYFLALAQLKIGKTEMAKKSIEIALQINPANDLYHALIAQIHLTRGNGSDAVKEASAALTINPRNFIAVKILAQSYVREKAFDKAVKLIEALNVKLVATDPELLGTAGIAYLGMTNKDKAKQAFTALLAIAPDNTKALSLLTALTFGNDFEKGIAFVKAHIAKNDASGHYLLLGDLYVKNRQPDDALQAFEKAQELSPANPQGYILRANLLHTMGKTNESIDQYNKLLQTQPNSIEALMGLATSYESLNRLTEAKEKYQRALQLQPELPSATNNLAWLLASEENGDLGEALRLAMQAKQTLPNEPHIADTLGWVHYKRKTYPLAISQFKQALENNPEDPTTSYHLALAQYANNEKNAAIALLERHVLTENDRFKEQPQAKAILQTWKNQ